MSGILGEYKFHHTCIVTKDLERLKKNFASLLGVEIPETIVNDDYEKMHTWFKGIPAPKTGLSQTAMIAGNGDGGMIELIMPNEGPSTWNDFLNVHGEGVHHFAFVVQDLDTVLENCKTNGMEKVQSGDFPGGRYAYVDGLDFCGAFLELMEMI